MEDFKKNPTLATPYLVVTCYDELVRTKGIALIRGDIVGGISKEEGQTVLNMMINQYLVDSQFEKVKQFNHSPSHFDIDRHTSESLNEFKRELDIVTTAAKKPLIITPNAPMNWRL